MPAFVTGMSIIILFHIHFLSNLFYCSIQYVRRSVPVASSYLLTYSPHVKLILMGHDGEDMIVLGTSGGGDDLVCNVVIFLGRVDFFRDCRGFEVPNLWGFLCRFGLLSVFPVALASILWGLLALLGLLTCLPPLRRPIRRGFLLLLDF